MLIARHSTCLLGLCCLAVTAPRSELFGEPVVLAARSALSDITARTRVTPATPLTLRLVCVTPTPQRLLVRAVGRGLPGGGSAEALPTPLLALRVDDRLLAQDRGGALAFEMAELARATGAVPITPLKGAPFANLGAALAPFIGTGVYSFTTSSADLQSGLVFVEARPLGDPTRPLVRAFSLVGQTGPGDALMTVGFVVGGEAPLRLAVRGISPALRPQGIAGTVKPPHLELHAAGAAAALAQTDQSAATGHALLHVTLLPGAYTVQLAARDGATTRAKLEIEILD